MRCVPALLRATNLTVTEICHLVGYASLGTFSTRFSQLVGMSPSAYQRAQVHVGAQHIPGCVVFMLGMQQTSAISEKRGDESGA